MENALHINSDYNDFYDLDCTNSGIIYNRKLSDSMQRGSALKHLRKLGVNTIDIKPVSKFSYLDDKLVVYTEPTKHNGQGKKICTYNDAITYYPNMPASKFIENTDGFTVKVLQIGKRRFNLTFKKSKEESGLVEGSLVDIKELPYGYNKVIQLPIFSIDYIPCNNVMVATDFNEVEVLSRLNIKDYISSLDVIDEIINALKVYNKIERIDIRNEN